MVLTFDWLTDWLEWDFRDSRESSGVESTHITFNSNL